MQTINSVAVSRLSTLREEILAGRSFGGSVDPPNPEQFGGIYFGGSREKFNLAGINFGGSGKKYIWWELILADSPNKLSFKKGFDRKKEQSTLNGMTRRKLPCSSFFTRNGV